MSTELEVELTASPEVAPEPEAAIPSIEEIAAMRPGFRDAGGDTTLFEGTIAELEVKLEAISAEHGPDSKKAEALRRHINHARYVK